MGSQESTLTKGVAHGKSGGRGNSENEEGRSRSCRSLWQCLRISVFSLGVGKTAEEVVWLLQGFFGWFVFAALSTESGASRMLSKCSVPSSIQALFEF